VLLRESENADHGFRLKPDKGLILNVKRPLEAAEVEVDAHGRSLPDSFAEGRLDLLDHHLWKMAEYALLVG
jgi:hypothetical protein